MALPATIDRTLLHTYLSDHATGAAGARARIHKMAKWYAESPIGPDLARIARQLDDEYDHLTGLIDTFGFRQPVAKRATARAGEFVGRLKANGRVLGGSPMTPLLELELLTSGVNGKHGLWQTLHDYAGELGLDAQVYADYARDAQEQSRTLNDLHAQIRPEALRPGKR